MGVEYRHFVLPTPRTFRPGPDALMRLIHALHRGRWISQGVTADPPSPMVRSSAQETVVSTAQPASLASIPLLLGRSDIALSWPVENLAMVPRQLYPFAAAPGAPEAYFDFQIHLSRDFVQPPSEWVEAVDTTCDACGEELTYEEEHCPFDAWERIRERCPSCSTPFDPLSREAIARNPFTKRALPFPGGAVYAFALVIDCGKSVPAVDEHGEIILQDALMDLVESVLEVSFLELSDVY